MMKSSVSPSVRATKKPRRSVSFSANAKLRLYRCNLTEEEKRAYYYRSSDYQDFKQDVAGTLDMIENNENIDDVRRCARGVACRATEALHRRIVIRLKAWDAVFLEQERQWEKAGRYVPVDDEAIALAYVQRCYSSRRSAYSEGLSDEKAANEDLLSKKYTHKVDTHSPTDPVRLILKTSSMRQLACSAA